MSSSEQVVTVTARETVELLPAERDASALGPREISGRTLASIISTGTELNACFLGANFPATPGYAAVFEVQEIGEGVTEVHRGDIVFGMGPHRSFQRMDAGDVVVVPPTLLPEHAVFARMMAVSMSTLTTTTARPPQRVLITGLGLVGHLAAQIFQSCGYEVIGCDPSAARRSLATAKGIRDTRERVPLGDAAVDGKVALVIECSGHEAAALDGCRIVQKRGEVVLIGVPWRSLAEGLSAHDVMNAVFHRYAVLRSGWEWEVPWRPSEFRANSIHGNFAAALSWLAEGRIDVRDLYETASPSDAQRIYATLREGAWPKLAAVFDWTKLR
ncbi:MAG: zinc-binding alcohol dehydrogenase [Candidatus Hydrogenedentes bacterium]|nr:zinc-binding alcohol dehydrogenase [Candidatus Hydrogenedentota bacterium]